MLAAMELAILVWLVVGAGITAGAFLVARAVVEIGAVAFAAFERTVTGREAARRSATLAAGAAGALIVTAVIGAIAVLAIFAGLLSTFGADQP